MPRRLLPLLLLLSAAALLAAVAVGSAGGGLGGAWAALAGTGDAMGRTVILELRLPRALGAYAVGGLLALAGALLQVLLRNPLADPYVLGISGGAAVAALALMAAGASADWLPAGAFGGALLSMALVFGLARRGGWTPARLLLTGVVVAAGWGAAITLLLTVSPDAGLRGMLFWLIGDLGHAPSPWPALATLAAGLAAALALARPLNLLALGADRARSLGVTVERLHLALYLLASLLTAAAVTLAGSVGFVGLVVPHLLRLAGARDHRILLPAAALAGGTLLTLADTLARGLLAPRQLPVGAVTALVGVPLFLVLLQRGGGSR